MRRILKRAWKPILGAALILLAATLVFVQTQAFDGWVLRRLEDIAQAAGVKFSARVLILDLRHLRMSLDGVEYGSEGVSIRARHVTVDVPRSIFRAEIYRLTLVEIDGAAITVVSSESAIPSPSGKPTTLPRIIFERLIVRNSSLSYTNQRTAFTIPDFAIDVAGNTGKLRLNQPAAMPPDLRLEVPEIPLVISNEGLEFGPARLGVFYNAYAGNGSTTGKVRWAPSLAVEMTLSTEPIDLDQWKGIEASGLIRFADGVLNIENFRARQNKGLITGAAEISDKAKTATLQWNGVRLEPSGIAGTTDGQFELNWTASDFSDAAGGGSLQVSTVKYGRATSSVSVEKGLATADLRASAYDVEIHGNATTGLDKRLTGSFEARQTRYGLLMLNGKLGGTWDAPLVDADARAAGVHVGGVGPIDGSAVLALRDNVLSATEIMAAIGHSRLTGAFAVVDLKKNTVQGQIPPTLIHLSDLLKDGSGEALLAGTVQGTLDNPTAAFDVESNGFDIGGTHVDSAVATGGYADRVLRIDDLRAEQFGGHIAAQGTLDTTNDVLCLSVDAQNLSLRDIRGLTMTISVSGTANGTLQAPISEFSGELRDIVYNGEDHGTLTLRGTTEASTAKLEAHSDKYNATIESTVEMKAPYPATARLNASHSEVHYQQYDGIVDGVAEVSGQLQPFELKALRAEHLEAKGEGISLAADGTLESGIRVEVAANLSELPVDTVVLGGSARAIAIVTGTLTDPRIEGTVETRNATIQHPSLPEAVEVNGEVKLADDRFEIPSLQAGIAGGIITINGNGTLKGERTIQFDAAGLRAERLAVGRPIEGVISAAGSLAFANPTLQGLSGTATVSELNLKVRGIDVQQAEPAVISIRDQVVSIDSLRISGSETEAALQGIANLKSGELALTANANTDLRLLEAVIPDSVVEGHLDTHLTIRGTQEHPNLDGYAKVAGGQLQLANPPFDLRDLNANLSFQGDRVDIAQLEGKLNGGHFTATGGAGVSTGGLNNAAVRFQADGLQMEYPEGFQSVVGADLTLAGTVPQLDIRGTVNVANALYREDIDLKKEIFSRVTNATGTDSTSAGQTSDWMNNIDLDVKVTTPGLVTVTNNLANLDLTGDFRVRGNVGAPVILGRASVNEGGELYFGPGVARGGTQPGERRDRYVIDRGTISFENPLRIDPGVDFEATHELSVKDERYLITLKATGTLAKLKTEFTSDPPLAERDIISMLLTGRTFTEVQSEYRAAAGEQLANYLTGEISGFFSTAGTALGLDTLRFDPVTLAQEEDLSARLTMGKRITRNFTFTFSQNLKGSRSQAWILDYNTFKNYVIRAVNETDERQVRLEFRQELRFGGGPALPRRVRPQNEPVLRSVAFEGTSFDMADLQKKVGKAGDPFGAYRMNDSVRRLRKYFTERDYLDVRIRPQRDLTDQGVDVKFAIEEGSKITFAYSGASVPNSVQNEVREIWIESVSDAASRKAATARILRHFRDEGFLQAQVHAGEEAPGADGREIAFEIVPGAKYRKPAWRISGIEPFEISTSPGEVLDNPETVQQRIERDLRDKGFIAAKASVPQLVIDGQNTWFDLQVDRGPQFQVSQVVFNGNAFFKPAHLYRVIANGPTKVIPADEGARPPEIEEELEPFPFTSEWLTTALERLQAEYWQQGFNGLELEPSTQWNRDTATVSVQFKIVEGERQMISSLTIEGAKQTNESYVRRQFVIGKDDPVDYSRINLTRKKLYDTGLFKRVDVELQPGDTGYAAHVKLNEDALWRVRYGFAAGERLSTGNRQLGVTADIARMNLWGKGISSGFSAKAQETERDARVFWSFPVWLNKDVLTTATAFRTRDVLPTSTQNFTGASIQQLWRLSDFYVLTYDFSYRRIRAAGPEVDSGTLADHFTLGRFNATLTRDTRDDILNATRGTLLSNSFEIAPPGVGSEFQYFRNFSQYLRFRQVRKNLVWASGIRLGFGGGLGGDPLVSTEQFFAGGATSLRGFRQDELTPEPGNATLIINQELRAPLFWRFGGVVFFDAGNIYRTTSTLRAWDLRYSPGVGIRINTPFVLLRADIGLNLWARAGEPPRRFAFGIGQAF